MDLRRNVSVKTGLLWPVMFVAACGSSVGIRTGGNGGNGVTPVNGTGGQTQGSGGAASGGAGGSPITGAAGGAGTGGSVGAGGEAPGSGGEGGMTNGAAGNGGSGGGTASGGGGAAGGGHGGTGVAGKGGTAGGGAAGALGTAGTVGAGGMAGTPGSGTAGVGGSGGSGGLSGSAGTAGTAGAGGQSSALTNKLDLLFLIDNSSSMRPLQQKLVTAFPSVLDPFKTNATTGQPVDLHVAVISSSLGGGAWTNVNQCGSGAHPGDDGGTFQQGPGGARSGSCAALNAGETYLSTGGATTTPNFTGALGDVFACMALLGDGGCGFESQFESVQVALTRAALPKGLAPGGDPDNGGFLRPEARLAVVMLTNEDDCSVPPNSLLLYPGVNSAQDSSGLGALQSYRCNEFGHLCADPANPSGPKVPPPHTLGLGVSSTLDMCVSAEDQGKVETIADTNGNPDPTMGHLVTVASFISFLRGLKADPRDVFVAALDGPSTPYVVTGAMNPAANEVDPVVGHACTQMLGTDLVYADPAVRINQWVTAFGANGFAQSICDADLHGIFNTLAAAVQGN